MITDNKQKTIEPVFIKRPVPSAKQAKAFERAVRQELRNEEVEDELSEIYGEDGNDLDQVHIKPQGNSALLSVFKKIFVAGILFCFAYGLFFYFTNRPADANALELSIVAPEKIKAGEQFYYTIHYQNKSKLVLKNLRLELKYPDSFIFTEASGSSLQEIKNNSKNILLLADLAPGQEEELKIRGRVIDKQDSAVLLTAGLSYHPADISSEFKKEVVVSSSISSLGFDVDFEYANAILAGEDNGIDVYFKNVKENFLDDFEVSFMFPENIVLVNNKETTTSTSTSPNEELLNVQKYANLLWKVKGVTAGDKTFKLPIYYQVNKKVDDNQEIIIRFNKKDENGLSYTFLEKSIKLNVMNSNLNLTLILNGSKNDGVANFGDTLNYSLTYANKSDSQINDIAIMAILKSEFLDWNTFKSNQKGIVSEQSIIWNKEQLPSLASLAPGAEGVLDFSINLRPFTESDLGKTLSVSSLAQFNINNRPSNNNDSKSNTIITKINSDLNLVDKILYFDDNNVPVGSGPLPPKVGEQTNLRVYWTLKNNLHDLSDVKVSMQLPSYVEFNSKNSVTSGSINFDPVTRLVTWDIPSLPVAIYRADAEFNISIRPVESDRDRILVLSPGVIVSATDQETKSFIQKQGSPKTTKLEDDDIASLSNSGRVE